MVTINYIGQCGFIISNDKVVFAVDPVLNDLVDDNGNTLRNYPPVLSYEELKADYIFCTHDHIDHMAEDTIKEVAQIHKETKFIVPAGCVDEIVGWGISANRIIGLAAKETIGLEIGALRVTGFSAAHPVHQVDDKGRDHNLVYCFELEGKKLVHLGDTYMTGQLEKDLEDIGHIDVLFPPINGRDEEREAKGIIGNLSCEEAAQLAAKLKVGLVIPTHFDMIAGNTANPFDFAKCLVMLNQETPCKIPTLKEKYVVM